MKKYIFSSFVLLLFSQFAMGQSVDKVFKYARAMQGVEQTSLTGEKARQKKNAPESVKVLEVITCEKSTPQDREQLSNKINTVKDGKGYETYLKVQEDDENVHILVKKDKKGNTVKEVVILISEKDEVTLVRFEGDFSQADVQKILDKKKNKKGNK